VPADEAIDLPPRGHVPSSLIEPTSYIERLDLEKIFGRAAPLHVDLGCGDGSFLCALAQRMPQKNFLGIERLLGRARSAARKAAKIDNARVVRMESFYAVRYLLPRESVEAFYLLFPDPWPKRRHQRRRVVNEDFLRAIAAVLIQKGMLRVATDQLDYFEHIKRSATTDFALAIVDRLSAISVGGTNVDVPMTRFEKRFKDQGTPIYRLELRKISPVT
jgi:tRNA (guanine-N7-)-methyltransferase